MFALFCAAVLLPRLGGLHVHLCLDGAAPAVYAHISDAASSQLADADHEDPSIDMSSPATGKLSSQGLGVLLVFAVLLLVLAPRQALLDRNANVLSELMGGRLKMMCLLFPADGEQPQEGEEPAEDDEPAQDDQKQSIRHAGHH